MVVHSIQYCTHHIVCWQKGKNRNKQNELNSRALWCDHEIKQVDWEYVLISQLQNLPAGFIYTPWPPACWPIALEMKSSHEALWAFNDLSHLNLFHLFVPSFIHRIPTSRCSYFKVKVHKQPESVSNNETAMLILLHHHHHLRCEKHNTIYQRTVLLILQFSFSNLFYSEAASGTGLVLKIRRMQNQLDR